MEGCDDNNIANKDVPNRDVAITTAFVPVCKYRVSAQFVGAK